MATFSEPYNYEAGYLGQKLGEPGALPAVIHLGGVEYHVRPELHCSLVAVKYLVPLLVQQGLAATPEAAEQHVTDILAGLITKYQPHVEQYTAEVRVAAKPEEGKQSLVIMVHVTKLPELFSELSATLQFEVPIQIPHVTLYTLANGLAIGITAQAVLDHLTRPLTDAESIEWHEQIDMKKFFGVTRG